MADGTKVCLICPIGLLIFMSRPIADADMHERLPSNWIGDWVHVWSKWLDRVSLHAGGDKYRYLNALENKAGEKSC